MRPATRDAPLKVAINLVTQAGSSLLRNLPFGGAVGVVAAGIILWFAPGLVPAGWTAEAVLSLGMGSGVVLQRFVDGAVGWFLEPARRHLGSRWEAKIRLGKLDGYRRRGMIPDGEAKELLGRIVREDLNPRKSRG